jgi:hypothetical protein
MRSLLLVFLAGILISAPLTGSMAQVQLPSPLLPPESDPPDCDMLLSVYHSGGTQIIFYGPGWTASMDYITHKCFTSVIRTAVGNDELETFDSVWESILDIDVDHNFVTLTGPVQTRTTDRLLSTTGTFPTEMISMSLSGSAGVLPVMLRESPTLASTGNTTITDLGGGLYHIDSFFDVFTELSLDGGNSWVAAESPIRLVLQDSGSIAVESSTWGKIKEMHK